MFEAIEVHMSITCNACGEPIGEEPAKNAIGESIELPSGLEILFVYHRACAPRRLVWATMREMGRWN